MPRPYNTGRDRAFVGPGMPGRTSTGLSEQPDLMYKARFTRSRKLSSHLDRDSHV